MGSIFSHFDYTPLLQSAGSLRIGVISDSHIPFRLSALPVQVMDELKDCQLILHAGDLEDPALLGQLAAIAPAHGVAGNIHWQYATGTHDLDLPPALTFVIGPHVIWLTHGHINFGYTLVDKLNVTARSATREAGLKVGNRTLAMINQSIITRLSAARAKEATIVVFGHSHRSCAERRGSVLYFNPGAVCGAEQKLAPPSMGHLTLHGDGRVDWAWTEWEKP